MRKYIILLFTLAVIAACASAQLPALNLGVNVSKQYLELRKRYTQAHTGATQQMQEYMEAQIAPELNKAREAILEYNDLVLRGTDPGQQREVIIELLVKVSRMMEVL